MSNYNYTARIETERRRAVIDVIENGYLVIFGENRVFFADTIYAALTIVKEIHDEEWSNGTTGVAYLHKNK